MIKTERHCFTVVIFFSLGLIPEGWWLREKGNSLGPCFVLCHRAQFPPHSYSISTWNPWVKSVCWWYQLYLSTRKHAFPVVATVFWNKVLPVGFVEGLILPGLGPGWLEPLTGSWLYMFWCSQLTLITSSSLSFFFQICALLCIILLPLYCELPKVILEVGTPSWINQISKQISVHL